MPDSPAWQYFVEFTGENGNKMVRCKTCKKEMTRTGGTTNMINHLRGIHKIELATLPPKGGKKKRTFMASSPPDTPVNDEDDPDFPEVPTADKEVSGPPAAKIPNRRSIQGPLDACVNNLTAFSAGGARDAQCINALLYMVCKDTMPLGTPSRPGFRKFVQALQPLFKIPSKTAVVNLLEEKYEVLSSRVADIFEKAEFITLTTDIWSHRSTMRSYLGVTAHTLIGTDLQSFELGAIPLEERKTTENLRKVLRGVCEKWKIAKEKVRVVVTDGGLNIKNAAKEEFGADRHVSCVAHINNLIGQSVIGNMKYFKVPSEMEVSSDAPRDLPENESDLEADDEDVEVPEEHVGTIRGMIIKVKNIVRFFRQSEIATSKLVASQRKAIENQQSGSQAQTGTLQDGNRSLRTSTQTQQPLKLIQEVATRWNSCYAMVDRYLKLADHVTPILYELKRDKTSKSTPPDVLTPAEEEELCEVRDLLSPLNRMTLELSTDKMTTLSKCIPIVRNLRVATEQCKPRTAIGKTLKKDVLQQISERLGSIESVQLFAVATLCDPRFKKCGFYQDLTTPVRVANAVSTLGELVKTKMREGLVQNVTTESAETGNVGETEDAFWGDFDRQVKVQSSRHSGQDIAGGIPVQLRMYLDTEIVSRKSTPNPLVPWETLKAEYKYVYQVAREYLSILATSVPSERLFSHAGLIASQLRTRLSGEHIDMLVFLRSCPEKYWF